MRSETFPVLCCNLNILLTTIKLSLKIVSKDSGIVVMIIRIYFYNNNNNYYCYPGECSPYLSMRARISGHIKVVCEMWLQFVLYLFFVLVKHISL